MWNKKYISVTFRSDFENKKKIVRNKLLCTCINLMQRYWMNLSKRRSNLRSGGNGVAPPKKSLSNTNVMLVVVFNGKGLVLLHMVFPHIPSHWIINLSCVWNTKSSSSRGSYNYCLASVLFLALFNLLLNLFFNAYLIESASNQLKTTNLIVTPYKYLK